MTRKAVERILHNARIITMNPVQPSAQALAISGGLILRVGANDEVLALAGPETQLVDLQGQTVTPGFIDGHAHMEREGLKTLRPSLAHARTIGDVLDVIRKEAARRPKGAWIITMPVGQPPYYFGGPSNLAEGRMPNRLELDAVAPEHPVYIPGLFGNWGAPPGHSALNSLALRHNHLDGASRPCCQGIELVRAANGELTGNIIETNKRPMLEFDLLSAVPAFSFDDRLEGLRRSQQIYHAYGTTSVYEGHGSAPQTLSVYRQLWEDGGLTMRSRLCISPSWTRDDADVFLRDSYAYARGVGLGDDYLRIGGINLGLGGAPESAAASRRALPNTGWAGFVEWHNTIDDYRYYAEGAARHNLRVHSVVDDRLTEVLDVFEAIDRQYPLAGRRWVVEHIGNVTAEDILRMRRLGIFITTNPLYTVWKNGAPKVDAPNGGNGFMPLKTLLEAGFPVSAGSDNIPVNPFYAVWASVVRQERTTGRVIGPAQRLSRWQALQLITSHGAWLSYEEGRKGTLEAGKLADLAVLSADPLTVPDEALHDIHAHLTFVGGQLVHGDLGAYLS
ncbi:amidohydrolase [Achromobacter seleniivolatilans]|uniref:Amidohydrolase n=1 Tax=Achromobacter seleniivolatilans TaxID=3047478 RepID=A0ABY9M3A1_9BURK|nr:amidohydrolase [Achromobacter sp. R39]WMD21487.1 amidohydrolase [Achromobacter sp. R39]